MAAVMSPIQVAPGWYWYDYDRRADGTAYEELLRVNKGGVWQRKVWTTAVRAAVLLQVTRAIAWNIGGKPTPAPKGLRTQLADMADGPDPTPGVVEMNAQLLNRGAAAVSETGSTFRILLWGGAAILLLNLFRSTAPVARVVVVADEPKAA